MNNIKKERKEKKRTKINTLKRGLKMDINNYTEIRKRRESEKFFENRISKRYLSVKSLSRFLDVSEYTIRKWILKGDIPFIRLNNSNTIRFDVREIERWVNPFV